MNSRFIVKRVYHQQGRRVDTTGIIQGPDAFSMALKQAEFWALAPTNKHVQILSGNGDDPSKFVLHQIVKG